MSEEEQREHGESAEAQEGATDDLNGVELLRAQLEEAQREGQQFRNLLQRVQADSVNYKRRVEEEREELQQRANAQLILRLLPVLDDYERALQHIPGDDAVRSWAAGVEMAYRSFRGVLASMGVTQIEAVGRTFDPQEHESMSYEITEDQEEGVVMSVVREGYKLHGRVLRPAQVTVSKRKQRESAD